MSFYPGLHTNHTSLCGGDLLYTADLDQKQTVTFVIPNISYSCEYRIQAPTLTYQNTGKILVWFERTNSVQAYIYSGNGRSNLTRLIEGNGLAAVGAPYLVEIDNGAVIIAHTVF